MRAPTLCLAVLAGCTDGEPPDYRVTGHFSGSITDDCHCSVDSSFEFQVRCDGSLPALLLIDAPTAGQQVSESVMVFYGPPLPYGVVGRADVVALNPGTVTTFDGYDDTYRPFTLGSADLAAQNACELYEPTHCADVASFSIRDARFNCLETGYW